MSTHHIGPAVNDRHVYGGWFEGLLVRALGHRLTPALIVDLRTAGVDLEKPLAPQYSAAVRLECVRLLRIHLFPDQSDEEAMFELGRAAVEGFLKTLVGQGFAVVFKMLGPRAVMKRAPSVMASASNYVSADTHERGPFRWEVRLTESDLDPAYYLGVVSAALGVCKVQNIRVNLESHTPAQLVLTCTWEQAPRNP